MWYIRESELKLAVLMGIVMSGGGRGGDGQLWAARNECRTVRCRMILWGVHCACLLRPLMTITIGRRKRWDARQRINIPYRRA